MEKLYLQLSAIMFLEYAIWGAWAPVLAARLLGPLKMSGGIAPGRRCSVVSSCYSTAF